MIEAPILMGPMGLGIAGLAPGGQKTPDCASYSYSLAFSAVSGMSSEQAVKAIESDVVSHILEHQLQTPVSFTDFFIRETEIRDRLGRRVEKKTLWSPDFGKSLQDVTNMEENDGQVWKITDRLSDRVVGTSGESWHLVASPGEGESKDHRVMLFHNNGNGRVREYFVTIKSSSTVLNRLVENLNGHNLDKREDISTFILSRERNKGESPITLSDIFTQFTNALDDRERKERCSFLEELKRDTQLSEKELERRNAKIQQVVREQAGEILKDGATLSALGLVAQSISQWAKVVNETVSYTSDNQTPTTYSNDMVYVHKRRSEETTRTDLTPGVIRSSEIRRYQEDCRKDTISVFAPIAHGFIAVVERVSSLPNPQIGKESKNQFQEKIRDSKDSQALSSTADFRSLQDLGNKFSSEVMEPIVPVLLIFVGKMASLPEVCLLADKVLPSENQLSLATSSDKYYFSDKAPLKLLQKMMRGILMPNSGIQTPEFQGDSSLEQKEDFFNFLILDLLMLDKEEKEERQIIFSEEKRKAVVVEFQKILEFVIHFKHSKKEDTETTLIYSSINPSNPLCCPFGLQTGVRWVEIAQFLGNGNNFEVAEFQILEKQIISIGEKIIEAFSEKKHLPFRQNESLVRLGIFLEVYFHKDTAKEARGILAVFIYQEIKQILTNKIYLRDFPSLRLTSMDFERLSKSLYFLGERIKEIFSFEKLRNINFANNCQRKKPKKKLPFFGIIYCFKMIYQYQPLVIDGLFVTQ